jgi:pyruvate formate lyase activating enzyme
MKEPRGLIFDIQSHSIHDGPGCRTSIFMMGCPLRCLWCANPEGREKRKKLLYRSSKCTHKTYGCNRCIELCPEHAINSEDNMTLKINWNLCKSCNTFLCTEECFYEALVICGKWITLPELMKNLNRDRHYWGSNGGVTFTGGEPLFQRDFLLAALKKCKESYIHTAIETSCYCERDFFLEVMKYIDFAFIDIKHMNREKHIEYTGVDNYIILNNIHSLTESDRHGKVIVRIPVIEGFNDDEENIIKTADFMIKLGLKEVNILSFNPLGSSKWGQCGMEYSYNEYKSNSPVKKIQNIFLEKKLSAYIDYNTPW